MSVDQSMSWARLARLEQILTRYMAEYAELEPRNPVRARHLADAIVDLQLMIARVRGESDPASYERKRGEVASHREAERGLFEPR